MINTKDIPTGGGKAPKTLQPGNIVLTINKIYLQKYDFGDNAYNLMLDCEGPDLGPNFEGFFINKEKEKEGRYKGQVGRVRANQWPYADKILESTGVKIDRDLEIAKMLKNIAIATDCLAWLEGEDGKHETIESLVETMNEKGLFRGKTLNACLAGREYVNKGGYTNYDLFLPKFSKSSVPLESTSIIPSNVPAFGKEHIIIKKVKEVSEFAAGTADLNDFELG